MKLLIHSKTSTVIAFFKFGTCNSFHPTICNGCNYLSILWLKWSHVIKGLQISRNFTAETILRPPHLRNGISYAGETTYLNWIRALAPGIYEDIDIKRMHVIWFSRGQNLYWYPEQIATMIKTFFPHIIVCPLITLKKTIFAHPSRVSTSDHVVMMTSQSREQCIVRPGNCSVNVSSTKLIEWIP